MGVKARVINIHTRVFRVAALFFLTILSNFLGRKLRSVRIDVSFFLLDSYQDRISRSF